ncbi:response regulator [Litchfieldia alkalitelluris]|uniref:hypothetical protein n=1 Tax=Litchfieldia alkalitelluris TaxID=304268 RepID=UPI00195B459B|nr:hypothetical protein [Litchfieldia alkalitelluris]
MYKIMLIEDDLQLSELIQENLDRYGYKVMQPTDFTNIIDEFVNHSLILFYLI